MRVDEPVPQMLFSSRSRKKPEMYDASTTSTEYTRALRKEANDEESLRKLCVAHAWLVLVGRRALWYVHLTEFVVGVGLGISQPPYVLMNTHATPRAAPSGAPSQPSPLPIYYRNFRIRSPRRG